MTDERGANVAGAEVRLRSRSNGAPLFTRTNGEGAYGFTNVVPGDHILEVAASGFAAQTSESFRIERGQLFALEFRLSVKALNETVVVVAT
ncbi:MAG TPA: carboxypeptidase-like regulatory domain-containing protein, partial [Pyrinomonadaceae bacterium]|nr:carboxypeptidase-like regulatory domain-containing protein [Pyrinomonadaceae bacterium]